jgi:hypothetical protein
VTSVARRVGSLGDQREAFVNIPKEMLVERIRARGDAEVTARAEAEFPEKVDLDSDVELLRAYDLDPAALEEEFRGQSPNVG